MNEVAALNESWLAFKKQVGLPNSFYFQTGPNRWSYATKAVYDRGWEAAMAYVEGQKNER